MIQTPVGGYIHQRKEIHKDRNASSSRLYQLIIVSPSSSSSSLTNESPSPASVTSSDFGLTVSLLSSASSLDSLSSSSSSSLICGSCPTIVRSSAAGSGASDTLRLAVDLRKPASFAWSRLLTILPRLTWILYKALRPVVSEMRFVSTASETSA